MTKRELLKRAKAVGGWYMGDVGGIRTRHRRTPIGLSCCPIAAVLGVDNFAATITAELRESTRSAIIATADNSTDSTYFDPKLRKEMESWCK